MKKKPVLVACLAIAVAAGIVFGITIHERRLEEQAMEERQSEILNDLYYANKFNFVCHDDILIVVREAKDDPARFTRVDFYDERPAGFELGKAEGGAIVVFPSERTQKSLDQLNYFIGLYQVDTAAFGFGPEVTMRDMTHRRAEIEALIEEICRESPYDQPAVIRDSIYDPE